MKKILVTGSSGFVGSCVAVRARQAGYEVLATARNPSAKLAQELGMSVTALDVLAPMDIEMGAGAVEAIVHCATANDIISRNFELGMNLSVSGTRNVLEFAVRNGIKNVMFLSTLQIYGTELNGGINESTPVSCQSSYSLNHYFGEELCRMYSRLYGLDVVLLRPSNIYGVPDASTVQRDTLVPMCFVKEAIQTGGIALRSSGKQQRNFISTNEVADACLHLLNDFPKGCEAVNVASNWLCSIREIGEIVGHVYEQRYGRELRLSFLSDEPRVGNAFTVGSQIASLRLSEEESRQRMINVILQLFDKLKHYEETAHD